MAYSEERLGQAAGARSEVATPTTDGKTGTRAKSDAPNISEVPSDIANVG